MLASSERPRSSDAPPVEAAQPPFIVKFLATGFYSGYSPIAPGTAGTVAGLVLYLIPSFEQLSISGAAILVGFVFGIYAGTRLENAFGHDPTMVVIDEMVGLWISLFLLPKTPWVIAGAFILFRIFDTVKPQPARVFQKRGGGFSIMMDDVVAGVYTNLIMHAVIFLISIF